MNVIFVEPAFPPYQRDFVRALHGAGARVIGIGLGAKGLGVQCELSHNSAKRRLGFKEEKRRP